MNFHCYSLIYNTLITFLMISIASADWNYWWTYDGISGPEFWGVLNPEWNLCTKGHRQSPIDIKPGLLLYDPNLKSISVNKNRVTGILENNGHSVVFYLSPNRTESTTPITINGGPLSYTYTFDSMHIHFGQIDSQGSEHSISGFIFPGEIQIVGYNSDLYSSFDEASTKANGVVGIAIFLKHGNVSSIPIHNLTTHLNHIKFRGQRHIIKDFSLRELIQDEQSYVTYDGSLTMPSCEEVVTWIVVNKPLLVTKEQLGTLRLLMQGGIESPKAPLANNYRPTQDLNDRVIRTSIDFRSSDKTLTCPTMKQKTHYSVNSRIWDS